MVKSTVRFPESVVAEIEALVDEGVVESKSEFYRFCTEYVLMQLRPDYEPMALEFDELREELIDDTTGPTSDESVSFLESLLVIRKYALRGNIQDAEDFIDHHYDPHDRDAILLEELLSFYHANAPDASTSAWSATPPEQ